MAAVPAPDDGPERAGYGAILLRRLLALTVAAAAVGGAAALLLHPGFVAGHLSDDGRLSDVAQEWLGRYRALAAFAALLFALAALGLHVGRRRLQPQIARRRDLLRRLGVASGAVVVGLVLAELLLAAVNAAAPAPRGGGAPVDFATHARAFLQGVQGQLNAHGLRAPAFDAPRPAGGLRILVLGDSMVFGFGVADPQATFPAALRRELLARRPGLSIEVLNAGRPGADTRSEADSLRTLLPLAAPDLLLLGYYLNDAESQQEKERFYAGQQLLPLLSENLLRRSAVFTLIESRLIGGLQRLGWRSTYFGHLAGYYDASSARWREHRRDLAGLFDAAAAAGVPAAAVIFPLVEGFQDYPLEAAHATLRAAFRELGVPCLDLLAAFRGCDARAFHVASHDHHLNAAGLRRAAAATADFLLEAGLLPAPH